MALRDTQPYGEFMQIDETASDIELPMERPLYTPHVKPLISNVVLEQGDEDVDAAALFSQVVIDKAALSRHIRNALQDRAQITLRELIEERPLQNGLAELIAYLQLASDSFKAVVDEDSAEIIIWKSDGNNGNWLMRKARMPRIIFMR